MLHASEGDLRRLEDEPFAIPDRLAGHVESCARCRTRLAGLSERARRCARALGRPQPVPDADAAWLRLQAALDPGSHGAPVDLRVPRGRLRAPVLTLRSGVAAGLIAVVVAGTAAAATLTTVFAPTHVAPLPLGKSDIGALTDFMGLGQVGTGPSGQEAVLGGFRSTSGTLTTPFGTLRWSSAGPAHGVADVGAASQEAGIPVSAPSSLPAGVAGPAHYVVQPRVEVTVAFDQGLPGVGGSTVVLDAGPAVLATYGSSGGPDVPTLGVLTMQRPVAHSSGATTSEIEAFLLDRPGLPPDLVQEIRLLGDLGTTLPVPVPQGATERSVDVHGSPGVLVASPSDVATGVVWEDPAGTIRAVAGLLDQHDLLDVADQLG